MAAYIYQAKDQNGNRFSGTYTNVTTMSVLRSELHKGGLTLLKARKSRCVRHDPRKVRPREVVGFAYQFAGMYSAGLSLIQCLETLEKQTKNPVLRSILGDIRVDVETGTSLKEAFDKHEAVFSRFFIGMIEAGESGAKLVKALERSAVYLEKRVDLRERLRAAFVYPSIVAGVALLVIGCLLTFVVPMFAKLYIRMHVELPGPTQFLILLSHTLRQGWYVGLLSITFAVYGVERLFKLARFQMAWDRLKLALPVFGPLNRLVVVSRFVRTFATLVSVGVSLIDAIELARVVANNQYMNEIAEQLQQSVRAGNPIAIAMQSHDIFPAMIVRLADSGEQAGALDEMLAKGADFLDKEIDRLINNLMTKLEPVLTLGLGMVIGLTLLGVYMPMFDYMTHVR